jgi:hypothetical protein
MRSSIPFVLAFTLVTGITVVSTAALAADTVTEPIHLLRGNSLDQFYTWVRGRGRNLDPSGVFSFKDGVLQIRPTESGYLGSKHDYSDYRMVTEFRWGTNTWGQYKDKARNSGIYVHAVGEDSTNSFVPKSLQVQIAEGATGDIELARAKLTVPGIAPRDGWIFERPGKQPNKNVTGFRGPNELEKPHGEWNTLEILCNGSGIEVRVNGTLTLQGTNAEPHSGRILIEAGNADIFFRRIDLLPLK